MMDVCKCLKLDASLQAGYGRQADWLKQKLGKRSCVSAVEGFFSGLEIIVVLPVLL